MKDKARLALRIISGGLVADELGTLQMELLGYDTCNFYHLGRPTEEQVKIKAEEILLDAIFGDKQ